jgi:hypothetical protein
MTVQDTIANHKEARFFVKYGRSVCEAMPPEIGAGVLQRNLERGMPESLSEAYTSQCEEKGLDPRNDDMKFSFLRSASQSSAGEGALVTYRHMFRNGIEPCVFDDDDVFYYLVGMIAFKVSMRHPILTILLA